MPKAHDPDWSGALARARDLAPFLARSLNQQTELADLLTRGDSGAALEWARQAGQHREVGIGLRRERLALATTLAIGDLAGALSLSEVVTALTDFADAAVDRSIKAAVIERTDEDVPNGFIALALGKQGAGELNYSSDIDPIFLYDPETLPRRSSDDPGEAAQRYAKRVVKLLSETTQEGYVLRVDLRLRPASEISPLAVPVASALSHYQGEALAWERAAFTRARAAAGDIAAGERFLEAIRPFIWRSALDFGAIEEIRALTRRIRANHGGAILPGPGFDVKRGRGGIREIEFFAQTHQLIHGGRDPSLRVRRTRDALDALARAGRIDAEHALVLGEGYDRLRVIEHRLQMVHDRQTHSLPEGEALDRVARLDGLADGNALVVELEQITEQTGAIYDDLIGVEASPPAATANPDSLESELAQLGFDETEALARRVAGWSDGRFPAVRSDQAVEALERLLPALLKAMAESDDPMRAVTRWEGILSKAASAITLFRLLDARPHLLGRLVAALTLAPALSDELARRPELLDTLLDKDALDLPGSVEEIIARMESAAERGDYEALLDAIRSVTGEMRFALGVQLIEAMADPLDIAAALSRVAEGGIKLAVSETEKEFAKAHGTIAGQELLVLGLGRLGGGALTHASDLDIVYLFTGEYSARSDGRRPLSATHYFNRLAARITAALSVSTAQGALYEVDTRLRPQGAQGPLAVSCEAFAKYQREAAWTWEHMALARARVLTGTPAARADLEAIMEEVLQSKRNHEKLREAVLAMRAEMAKHKQPKGELDAKLLRGGLVDLEFIVHFQQLRGRMPNGAILVDFHPEAFNPNLGVAVGALSEAGLISAEARDAHDLMARLLVASRLLAPDGKTPPACAAQALAVACGAENFDDLLDRFAKARQCIAEIWNATFGETLDLQHSSQN